jgi:hypothetical protein
MKKNKLITIKKKITDEYGTRYGYVVVEKLKNGLYDLFEGDEFVHLNGNNVVIKPSSWGNIKNLGFAKVKYYVGLKNGFGVSLTYGHYWVHKYMEWFKNNNHLGTKIIDWGGVDGYIVATKLKNGMNDLEYGDKFVHLNGNNIVCYPKCDWRDIKNLGFAKVIWHHESHNSPIHVKKWSKTWVDVHKYGNDIFDDFDDIQPLFGTQERANKAYQKLLRSRMEVPTT